MRKKELILPASAFVLFITIRLGALFSNTTLFDHYGDGFLHYVPAGIAYLRGVSVDSVNPEHPPLAKYIIGFFQLYLGGAQIGSILFSVGMCLVAFFLARELVGSVKWASLTIWFLGFDMIMVSISVYPLLDVFALFLAIVGLYFTLKATRLRDFLLTGLVFGFAVACKWIAVFWLIPALVFMIWERHLRGASAAAISSVAAYIIPYVPFIAQKGGLDFLNLQIWMFNFMYQGHGTNGVSELLIRLIDLIFFYTIGYISVPGFDPTFHFEGFHLLGGSFIFYGHHVTLPIFLLLLPIAYVKLKSPMNRTRRILALTLLSALVMQVAGELLDWHLASMILLLSIFAADLFKNHLPRPVTYVYLWLVASWPLWANLITSYFVFHMLQAVG
jgi:hypothetical protein